MNKSKFLKKSLAALLAILMVVAMIPLSAAAEEAPEEPGVPTIAAPDVTVNNRNTTKPQQAGEAYTVTVQDATSVSMAWVPVKDEEGNPYSAQVVTARDVTIGVPFNMLDLLQEGKVIEENTEANTVTYQVTFQVVDKDKEVVGEWPLNITVVNTVPNDDTTIKAVVANQSFRDGATNFAFLGIKGDIDNTNEIITITLPLGMDPISAGFGTQFGDADTVVDDNNSNIAGVTSQDIAARVQPAGGDGTKDTYARKVFVPTSIYTTVSYTGPATNDGAGKLVVTARDGRTRNYTVNFVQEEAFENIGVSFGNDGTYYSSNKIVRDATAAGATGVEVEYIIAVPENLLKNNGGWKKASLVFALNGNVVRVEDPKTSGIADIDDYDADKNVPLVSGRNTMTINTDFTAVAGSRNVFDKYITVKTEANMGPNKTGLVDTDFWKNVKITLRPQTGSTGSEPKLTEFQLNGYDSKWNNGEELPESFEYWVDYDFEFSTGDGQHPARISALINDGGSVSIPAQDRDLVANSYWAVEKTNANGSRMEKPNKFSEAGGKPAGQTDGVYYHFIDNVNTEGGTFVLRVWSGENYKDYTITLRKPTQNTGTAVSGVKLLKKKSDGTYDTLQATKSADGRVWTFEVPTTGTFGGLLGTSGTTSTTSKWYASGFAIPGAADADTTHTGETTAAAINLLGTDNGTTLTFADWADGLTTAQATVKTTVAVDAGAAFLNAIKTSALKDVECTATTQKVALKLVKNGSMIDLQAVIGANSAVIAKSPLAAISTATNSSSWAFTTDGTLAGAQIITLTVENVLGMDLSAVNWFDTGVELTDAATLTVANANDKVSTATAAAITASTGNLGGANDGVSARTITDLTLTTDADGKAAIAAILAEAWSTNPTDPTVGNVEFSIDLSATKKELYLYAARGSEKIRIGSTAIPTTGNTNTNLTFTSVAYTDHAAGSTLGTLVGGTDIGTWANAAAGTIANTEINWALTSANTGTYVAKTSNAGDFGAFDTTTTTGSSDLGVVSSVADDTLIIVDTPLGAVVTPGGEYNTRRTPVVGVSTWGVGNGFNEQFPEMTASTVGAGYTDANNLYEELEEGVTTLADWWNAQATVNTVANTYKYLINMGANIAAQNNIEKDGMIFSVKNGRNGTKQPYVLRFKKKAAAATVSGSEINASAATTAIDEDLVYGSSTVTNAVIVQNSNIVSHLTKAFAVVAGAAGAYTIENGSSNAATGSGDAYNKYYNPGFIDPNNAAYVGAIGGHNEFLASDNKITVAKVDNTAKEYVITVHVPADFMTSNDQIIKNGTSVAAATGALTNAIDAPGAIFFTNLTASSGATVFRNAGAANAPVVPNVPFTTNEWRAAAPAWNGNLTNFTLDLSTANQQGLNPTDEKTFLMSDNDLLAWKGGVFDSSKVSQGNILYVYRDGNVKAGKPVAGQNSGAKPVNNAFNDADAVYYVTVVRDADQTGDQLVSVSSASDNVTANVNQALKTVTVNVPASYNWIGTRDNASHDFQLNFNTSDGAILIDAVNDDAFGFRDNNNNSLTYQGFSLTDLVQQEQDINKWVSADKDAANATKFFVKDNELFMYNENTGSATQVTGMGDEIKDAYINPSWRLIMDQEAELRVYPESRSEVNTYKLTLNILPESSIATLTHVQVNESTAEIDNDARTAKVELPQGTDIKAVRISVGVNGLSHVVSVAGETYDPNNNTTYDLTNPIAIVIEAENGTQVTYTLTAGDLPSTPAEAEITKLTVDGVEAEVNNTARTASVELPEGSDLSKVKLAIEVSEGDKLVSVAGEEFDAEAEYDLSSPIAIVIEAEDGTKYDYTLTGTVAKPVEPENPADKYTDLDKIQKEETRDEVKKAINLGLMNGISESKGIFGVGMKMQRFQFALVVARADLREKLLAEDENADVTVNTLDAKLVELYPDNYTFTDVSEKIELKAAAAAVQYCYDKGYINGKSLANKIFDPTGNITREEAAKIMVLWAGLEHEDTDVSAIPDGDQISNWAKGYVKAAADAGIMKGRTDGNFDPKGDLQRQDGACLLVRTYENYIVKADEDETPDDGDDDNDDNNNGDDDTNTPGDDDENNGGDTSNPDDDTSSTPEDGDDDSSSTPDGEDDNSSSTPDEDNESQPAE